MSTKIEEWKDLQAEELEQNKSHKEKMIKEYGEQVRKMNEQEANTSVKRKLFDFFESPVTETKEWYIDHVLIALNHFKPSSPTIKKSILDALKGLIQIYQKENNSEKTKQYAKIGLAKAQEWSFESFEKEFETILQEKKPAAKPHREEKKPQQPKQEPLKTELTKKLQELYTTLKQLEMALNNK